MIDNQPIGKKLFRQFCAQDPIYHNIFQFLEAIDLYELSEVSRDKLTKSAQQIIENFLNNDQEHEYKHQSEFKEKLDQIQKDLNNEVASKNVFNSINECLDEFLYDKPFLEFVDDSMYFKRYLQIKQLERKPITKNTFRMYRVLGKG